MSYIPVYQPSLTGNEKKYVDDCIESSWISSKGKYVSLFEEKFAEYIGTDYGVAVTNGTVALHLAMLALGIAEGDEVIVPTLTYIASANAISYVGARPVFVDSEADTWQMDPEDVRKKITSKTKAVMAVHLYGHPCNMSKLQEICNEYNLFLIEDCAEAIGTEYCGKKVGTFGDVACFSFFGNKTMTCGEGGMLLTSDKTLYERANHIKGQGLAKYREYWHDVIGYNFRMTNIHAAIGLAQLEQVDKFVDRKIEVANLYKQQLSEISNYVCVHNSKENVKHTYWMVSILVNSPEERDLLREFLKQKEIETRPLFYPIHTMPMYSSEYQKHKIAEDIGWRGINLPSWPGLQESDITYICNCIKDFYNERN